MLRSLFHKRAVLRWLAVFLFGFIGCQGADHAPEEDHESHEHFPPHWPYNIFKASDRLNELIGSSDTATSTAANTSPADAVAGLRIAPHQEFVDLVGWLPILAADSDLDRAVFNRIDAVSTRLELKWRKSQPHDIQTLINDPEAREMIGWLSDVCRQEQARVQQYFNIP